MLDRGYGELESGLYSVARCPDACMSTLYLDEHSGCPGLFLSSDPVLQAFRLALSGRPEQLEEVCGGDFLRELMEKIAADRATSRASS